MHSTGTPGPAAERISFDREMPFTEHLSELRSRLLRVIAVVSIMAFFAYRYAEDLFKLITLPLHEGIEHASAGNALSFHLIGTGPAEAFIVKLKVAVVTGVLLSTPVIFHQIWRFIAPALYLNERKLALPFVASSTGCFLLGAVFCFKFVLPFAFGFFLGEYASIGVNPDLRIGEYLSFSIQILLVFGVVFELPVLSYFLARMRLVTHRWLIARLRPAIVIIFIIAAILTPPDVVTQCLLAAPLLVLYAICIVVTYYAHPEGRNLPDQSANSPESSTPNS